MKQRIFLSFIYISTLLTIASCIEAVELNNNQEFKSNIVISAILTDEFKKHTIQVSKTVPVNADKPNPEKNASVNIIDNTGTTYNFIETEDGIYTSATEFAARANVAYTLQIQTENGKRYTSKPETLPLSSEIEDITINVENNDLDNIQEAVIRVNSTTTNDSGKYFRYEYDETFKVQALFWRSRTIIIKSDTRPYEFELINKDPSIYGDGSCYGNEKSKEILITETISLDEDRVLGYPIRKIPLDHYRIGRRYSILVTQYVMNQNTYNFYDKLEKFSDGNNIFSETQVGNIPNNIIPETNPNDNVVGFFEVSSVSSKRVFFNRSDFTDTDFKDHVSFQFCNQEELRRPLIEDAFGKSPLLSSLQNGWVYLKDPDNPSDTSPYILIRKVCGECDHVGQPTPPSFWTE